MQMIIAKSKRGASPCEEATEHITDSSNNASANIAEDKSMDKIIGVFCACKVVICALLVWLMQCSGMYSGAYMKGYYNMGRPAAVRPNRLLGQPVVEFDSMFDLYQKSFLDKMGCDSNQKDQIKTMMKSYFDKIDLGALAQQFQQNPSSILQCPPGMPGMFEPSNVSMFGQSNPNESKNADAEKKKKKKNGQKDTSDDGDEQETKEEQDGEKKDEHKTQLMFPTNNNNQSPVSYYLNFFNFLWSSPFIVLSSVISACSGQLPLTVALISILLLKGVNLSWDLKIMYDTLFQKKK
ncbi:hypothetical protein AK88_02522 [Plasmodium fragile]|uniref:Pv-fam-h protein n=1 Tax=Plasmodium fragile TaxID=5857 RepID=A0A0D9QQ02_PLAFR|nr:uncharacterized protein AK88_02521 [Plasmodium fragile]XP_012335570.1 uncharacterized protein AK88_02522 [Plasmodium fragile]KJP87765.1 hypothetical protein AK88_02521 [Plasmodium fragile]KJP87766.1 hypothetical protein AK88_02522 [Plasmodium fragile]